VQITRKYLQSKKAASTSAPPTQSNSNRGQKQIQPICPPNGGNSQSDDGPGAKSAKSNATRYSTMLAMSAMDDFPLDDDKKPRMVLRDINDNVQPLDSNEHRFQDKTQWKKDADNFPNFDMWNSNLVPPLPNSPTSSDSSKPYDESLSLDKVPNKSFRDWENDTVYPPSQTSLLNGYQYSSDSGVSNCHSYYNLLANKVVDQTRPIAAVHRYQNYPACYVLLQPPPYLYSKDVMSHPQSSLTHHAHDGYNCRSYRRNEQIGVQGSVATYPVQIGEKLDDYEIWCGGILTKAGNSEATSRSTKPAVPCYVQNSPNLVLNFTPICTPTENATSCFVPLDVNGSDERRPRPILKQETARAQL